MKQDAIAPDRAERRWRVGALRVLLLVEICCAAYFIVPRGATLWKARWVQDDAYVSFRYARNLVRGDGLVYNVGERVEGYSNFLWTMLSAVPLAVGAEDPLPAMHVLSIWLWFCSYGLLIALGVRLFREGQWVAPLAALPLAHHWSYNMWFVSGMETPLVCFLTLALICIFAEDPERRPANLFWASLAGVALILARLDGVVTLAGVTLAGVALYWRPLLRERKWRRYLGLPLLPVLLILVPYNLWRIFYFGDFFPNTYYAKVAYLTYYSRGWEYLRTYLEVYPLARFLPLAVAGAVVAPPGAVRRFLWAALLGSACVFFYVVRLGGDFMEWRFVAPVTGLLYPAIVIGAGVCAERLTAFLARRFSRGPVRRSRAERSSGWSRAWGAAAGVCVLGSLTIATDNATPTAREIVVPGQENIALLSRYCDPKRLDWETVGRTYHEVLPPQARIATTSAGIIPYYSEHHTLDLHGLTDPDIARSAIEPDNRGRMGHEKWLDNLDEIRARGVDVLLYWADPRPVPLSLVSEPREDFELVSMRLPDGRYTEFAILNHDRIDMQALHRDPRLVFYGALPLADRHLLYTLRDRFAGYETVDSVDLEEAESHTRHELEELYAPETGPGHNWHDKILFYRPPPDDTLLRDDGFIPWGLRWKVHNVSARRELVMVVRSDGIGGAIFDVAVNGRVLSGKLQFPAGPEAWTEVAFRIPARFLVDGTNELVITSAEQSQAASELYYAWFLQRRPGSLGEMAEPREGHPLTLRSNLYALRQQFAELELVDELDLEEADSQGQHRLREIQPPGGPPRHDWHMKTLGYRTPFEKVVVTDNGVIPYGLEWRVDNISAGKDLVMIVRFDRTGGGIYDVEVNGKKLDRAIEFPRGSLAWDEVALTIPRGYLLDGSNELRMVRSKQSRDYSELYYMWFLQ